MYLRVICVILLLTFVTKNSSLAQSYWFGPKGGFAMNNQSWGNGGTGLSFNRSAMFSINGDFFVESYDELKKGSLYAQIGYHTRGSSLRFFDSFNNFNSNVKYKFNNIVLELGAKKLFNLAKDFDPYFIMGVRGEYTIGNNLSSFNSLVSIVSPQYIRKFNYGVTIGGGFESVMSEFSNVFVEFSIQPDFSFQYEQFPIEQVVAPWSPTNYISLPLTQVKNLSIEAKVGVKFLRKVEYID